MNQKCIKRRFGISGHGAEEDGIPNTLYKWKSGNMARFAMEFPDFYLESSTEFSK